MDHDVGPPFQSDALEHYKQCKHQVVEVCYTEVWVLILFTAEVRVVGALVPAPTEVFLPVLHILQARLYADTPALEDS